MVRLCDKINYIPCGTIVVIEELYVKDAKKEIAQFPDKILEQVIACYSAGLK